MKAIKDPSSKPIKITSAPEGKHSKEIPAQYIIITRWTKKLNCIEKIPQEYPCIYNNKFHPLETKSRRVVEEDRLEAAVDAVDVNAKVTSDIVAITHVY